MYNRGVAPLTLGFHMIVKIAKKKTVQRWLWWYGNDYEPNATIVVEMDFSAIGLYRSYGKPLPGDKSDRYEDKYVPDCTASCLIQVPSEFFFFW